ncbi:hypothetical protein FACS1894124_6240 [Spirochaetia bacterium]|nr:hypothetical protein FACS1894124_6240 [Spirochaetia bacterium]
MRITLRITALAAALLALSCQSTQRHNQVGLPAFSGDKTRTTLENGGFEDFLNGWVILSGDAFIPTNIVPSTLTFWGDRDFMAKGEYFLNGFETPESGTGKMCSELFTLSGDGYISFLIGGGKTARCYISVHTEDGRELARFSNAANFKDPEMALNLHREYMNLSAHIGKVLYIQLNDDDGRDRDFAAMTCDDFIVSMTEVEVKTLMKSTYEEIMALEDIAINRYIKNFYRQYRYPFQLGEKK